MPKRDFNKGEITLLTKTPLESCFCITKTYFHIITQKMKIDFLKKYKLNFIRCPAFVTFQGFFFPFISGMRKRIQYSDITGVLGPP